MNPETIGKQANRGDKIYFLLGEMTHLRYFIPLSKEFNKRNIQTCFLVYFSGKYNCPSKHKSKLNNVCVEYNIEKTTADQFKEKNKTIFCVEKSCSTAIKAKGVPQDNDFYVLTYHRDFTCNYDVYEKFAKNIIFPSDWTLKSCEYFIGDNRVQPTSWSAEKVKSPKNVCLGSPKYDTRLDKTKIIEKYNLTGKRKILFLFPNPCGVFSDRCSSPCSGGPLYKNSTPHGLTFDQINILYNTIRSENFEILVKSRGKHFVPEGLEGDRLFYDEQWFPHITMELMEISDLVVMADTTSIEECVIQRTPFIDFDVKNKKYYVSTREAPYGPLFDFDYCRNYSTFPEKQDLRTTINFLANNDFKNEFQKATSQYLSKPGESSRKIVDFVLEKRGT